MILLVKEGLEYIGLANNPISQVIAGVIFGMISRWIFLTGSRIALVTTVIWIASLFFVSLIFFVAAFVGAVIGFFLISR